MYHLSPFALLLASPWFAHGSTVPAYVAPNGFRPCPARCGAVSRSSGGKGRGRR